MFGWDTLELGPGMSMWTQPGYGDHLEASYPGLRAQMAELGAPPRFEDVVASMVPCQDGEEPHWSVTFAVDDADAIAQAAAELGGEVTVPPFDAPWVRTTVITDPQGASFMASKFVPENKDLLKAPVALPGGLASPRGAGAGAGQGGASPPRRPATPEYTPLTSIQRSRSPLCRPP